MGDADDIAQALPIFVTKQHISGERNERSQRLKAVNFARASVGLEGFEISNVHEEHAGAYVEGEITLDEFIELSSAPIQNNSIV